MLKRFEFQITEENHRQRLDNFLFENFSELGKKFLRRVLKEENCEVNGYTANGGVVLKKNDFVEIEFDYSAQNKMFPEKMPLDIIFEDAELIVVNKTAGMLVHPTPKERSGTLVNGLAFYLNKIEGETGRQGEGEKGRRGDKETRRQGDGEARRQGDFRFNKSEIRNPKSEIEIIPNPKSDKSQIRNPKSEIVRPGLVHRLDRETSGLILIAKTARALRILNSHFKRKLVEKKYLAVVEGVVKEDSGEINAPIGRYEDLRLWNVKLDGKEAVTRFCVLERSADATLLELEPVTGRTNQLRIHTAYMGHPILGDSWHAKRKFPRLCLHAAKLSFWHPNGGERLEFEIGLPGDMEIWRNS